MSKDEVITSSSVRKTNKKALVIAVSEYNSPTLKSIGFCKNDGQEMSEVLKKLGYDIPDNRILIGIVNYQTLTKAIYDFFTNEDNKPDDTLVFYYSGHGVPDRWGTPYLAPSDIDSDRPFITGFSFDDLTNSMLESNSLSVVTILDSCYSGSLKISKGLDAKGGEEGATRIANKMIEEKSNKLQQGIGRCLLASSQGYEEAYDRQEKDHSIFTFYLLEGLKGSKDALDDEGNVTYDTLGKFITKEFANLPSGKRPKQTPIRKGEVSGGEIVLANYPEFRRIKEDYYSLFGKGENFYIQNKYREALECYNAILQTRPEDQFTLQRIGDILFNLNEDKKALECFNRLIELNDSNSDAWYYKAQLHLKTMDYETAYNCLDQATNISPNDEKIWESYKKVKSLLRSSRKLGKRATFVRQEEIPVRNSSEKENTIDQSVSVKENFQANTINTSSEKTNETGPNKFTALNNKGTALYNGGKYEEAIQYFDEALQIDPYNEDTIYSRFRAFEKLLKEKTEKSEDQINKQKIADIALSDSNHIDISKENAIGEKVPDASSNNIKALNNKGLAFHEQGRYEEAIVWYDKALEIDPDFEIAKNNRKLALEDLSRERRDGTYQIYRNVKIKPKNLAEELTSYLKQKNFNVIFRPDEQHDTYYIQASKKDKLSTLAGISKSLRIVLRGIASGIEISLTTGAFRQNLAAQLLISAPIAPFTLGMAPVAALGTTYLTNKKFNHGLWKFIESKISTSKY